MKHTLATIIGALTFVLLATVVSVATDASPAAPKTFTGCIVVDGNSQSQILFEGSCPKALAFGNHGRFTITYHVTRITPCQPTKKVCHQ